MKRNLYLIGERLGFWIRCLWFYFFLEKRKQLQLQPQIQKVKKQKSDRHSGLDAE